jgi:hypothetical protein
MFKRKKRNKMDLSIAEMSSRVRGFLLDSQFPEAYELSVLMGCSVVSEEIAAHEEEDSEDRVERVASLIPILYAYSHTISEGAVEYQRKNIDESLKAFPEELWTAARRILEQVTMSVLLGAVSQLVDMEFLKLTGEK